MGRTGAWLSYARSGDRMYYDYASAFSRHISDFRFCYWSLPDRPFGAKLGDGISEQTPFYWTGVPTFFGVQGNDLRHFYYQYYLTGDRWAVEALKPWSRWMAERFHPVLGKRIAGSMHVAYWMLAQYYGTTWDDDIGGLLRQTRDEYLDLETSTGLFDIDYYGAAYKYPVEIFGALSDWLATGSDVPRTAFLKTVDRIMHSVPDYGPGYQDHSGVYMAYAWQETGDSRYANWIAERLGRLAFRYVADDGRFLPGTGYARAYVGPWNTTVLETVAYGLSAAAATDPAPGNRWPASQTGDTVMFVKPPHEPVTLDLTFGPDMNMQLVNLQKKADANRRDYQLGPVYTEFRREYFTRHAPGLGGGYGRLTLPTEVLPGEYQLSDATILATNIRKLVSVIPEGAWLDAVSARPRRWFFVVPPGKTGSVCANRTTTMSWAAGRTDLAPGVWKELRGTDTDVVYALVPAGRTYVRFAGDIPPVLAEHDPERLFVPRNCPAAVSLGQTETPANLFVSGRSKTTGDQALLLTGERGLTLPTGNELATDVYEYFNNLRGTLEFWFKPQWTSRFVTEDRRWYVAHPCAWQLWYGVFAEEGLRGHEKNGFHLLMGVRKGTGVNAHWGHNFAPVDQGRWYHFAVCWDTLPERGWVSLIYVDGKAGSPAQPGEFRLARHAEHEEDNPESWRANPVQPRNPLRLAGTFDAAVDDIRISDVVRYPTDFRPPSGPVAVDEHTLLLLRLDGKPDAVAKPGLVPPAVQLTGQ